MSTLSSPVTISLTALDPTRPSSTSTSSSTDSVPKVIPLLSSNSAIRKAIGLDVDVNIDDVSNSMSNTNRIQGSIPLSLPAILRNPKVKPKSGAEGYKGEKSGTTSGKRGEEVGGKRRRRRKREEEEEEEEGRRRSTDPTTLRDPLSTNHGAFSLSLRGLRKEIRSMSGKRVGTGPSSSGINRTEELVHTIEEQLLDWLNRTTTTNVVPTGYYHASTSHESSCRSLWEVGWREKVIDSTPVEDWVQPANALANADDLLSDLPVHSTRATTTSVTPTPPPSIVELARSTAQLVWVLPSPQARYLLHAVSRYYRLKSYSRPLSPLEPEIRVTRVVRARNLDAADWNAPGLRFDTPPGTDLSEFSATSSSELEEDSYASSGGGGGDDYYYEGDEETGSEFGSYIGENDGEEEGDETFETIRRGDWTEDEGEREREEFITDDEASSTDGGESINSSIADSSLRDRNPTPFLSTPSRLSTSNMNTDLNESQRLTRAEIRTRSSHLVSDSSPSKSPDRNLQQQRNLGLAPVGLGQQRMMRGAGNGEWEMPKRRFVDFLYA